MIMFCNFSLSSVIRSSFLTITSFLLYTGTAVAAPDAAQMISHIPGIELKDYEIYKDSGHPFSRDGYKNAIRIGEHEWKADKLRKAITHSWLRFKIINLSDSLQKILLILPAADSIYSLLQFSGSDTLRISGDLVYNAQHRCFQERRTTPVFINKGDTIQALIRLSDRWGYKSLNYLRIETRSPSDFFKVVALNFYTNRKNIFAAVIFLSIVLFQLIYMAVQGVFMRRIEYFYYICYAFSIGIYYLARYETELEWQLFFSYFPMLSVYLNNVLLFLPFFFYYRFARHFCEIEIQQPKLAEKIKAAEKTVLIFCTFLFIQEFGVFTSSFAELTHITGTILILLMSVYLLWEVHRIQNNLSRILVWGSILALTASMAANLSTYSHWLYVNLPVYPLELTMIGVAAEMVMFNAGLVYKTRLIEREKSGMQEKLLQETEANARLVLQNIDERDRIAADLHDDIGATLSSISIYSDSAVQKLKLGDNQRSLLLLEQIGKNARLTMNNMSDIVWAINPVNDDSSHLIDKMESYASSLLQSKGIYFHFNFEKLNPASELPPGIRKNIFLIFKESVNNCVKYSEATRLETVLSESENEWEMTVSDNGKGFDPGSVKKGNGMINIQHRAEESGGSVRIVSGATGTSLNLKIPK